MTADGPTRIASVDDVPEDTTFLFAVRDASTGDDREAVLVRVADGVAGWLNHCQHFRHVPLDKGSGAPTRDGEIVCTNHGAMFEADTGHCAHGPCEGAHLDDVDVAVDAGDVYLTDDRFEFAHAGPVADADDDLTSTSNVEF